MYQARLINAQHPQICKYKGVNRSMIEKALSAWETKEFNLTKGLTQPSISNIIKKCDGLEAMESIILNDKRQLLVQHSVVENAVVLRVLQCQHFGVIITGDLIR